jgi:hypothetical protein
MSEWGRRKGTDFEQSIAAMLTYLGFKIVAENISIKCLDPSDHKTTEHSIDFLAEHDASVPRLFKSYDGLTFFDCTSREEVTETQFMKASQTLKCLRRTDPYAGMSGSIVVTARRMTPQLREDLNKHSDIMCWDLDHVSLYGALARAYVLSTERKCYAEIGTGGSSLITAVLYKRNIPPPPEVFYGDLFYESDARMNRDELQRAISTVHKVASRWSTTYLTVHSLSGFTSDIPNVVDAVAKKCSSRFRKIEIPRRKLFDYTRPWFPAFPQSTE